MVFHKKCVSVEYIVVFLGNPGAKYTGTRHNVGFMTADEVEKNMGISINRAKFHALTERCNMGEHDVLLMKPQTYMNLSGDAVREAMKFYKVPLDHIVVVSDDVSLPVGKIRIRRSGSAGGHNGLKDIIVKCGGEGFPRIKIGVGEKPHPDYDMAQWVLSAFKDQDAEDIAKAVKTAAEAVECLVVNGVDKASNKYSK